MPTKVLPKVKQSDLGLMIQLMSDRYSDFTNQNFKMISKMISAEFDIECTPFDIESYYTTILEDNFEVIERSIIYDYEDNNRFRETE